MFLFRFFHTPTCMLQLSSLKSLSSYIFSSTKSNTTQIHERKVRKILQISCSSIRIRSCPKLLYIVIHTVRYLHMK